MTDPVSERRDAGDSVTVPAYIYETVARLRECRTIGQGLTVPEDYGRRWRYSKAQARHMLNVAVHYGVVEKVRLTSVGIDAAHAGAHFGYRPSQNASGDQP